MKGNDEYKCLICNKEQEVLVGVRVKGDLFFARDRGVCQECLKTKDINKVCKEFSIRKMKEKIKACEESIESFSKDLKELEK